MQFVPIWFKTHEFIMVNRVKIKSLALIPNDRNCNQMVEL